MDNHEKDENKPVKKPGRLLKIILIPACILVVIALVWIAFSMIGRINAASAVSGSVSLRISIPHPLRLMESVLTHESLHDISSQPVFNTPELLPVFSAIMMLQDTQIMRHSLLRIAARGNIEFALLPEGGGMVAAWDMGIFSPLLRILPAISRFVNIPNLYYVQSGKNSRFELRIDNITFFIGPHRNLLFITDNAKVFESRSLARPAETGSGYVFTAVKPSDFDAALLLSNKFVGELLADQDPGIAAVLQSLEFDSMVEAGLLIQPRKLEFFLAAPVSSRQESLNYLLGQRSHPPVMKEHIPADAQYATILSAGSLRTLYQAALVFMPDLNETLRSADNASRFLLGLTLDDLLFSWTGNEFAVFGLEGRPHPVYAIQIADERRRTEVFNRAFRSIVLNEDIRLNLDGMRIPRIEIPDFLQNLLRRWDIFMPSPFYIIHRDLLLASESAEALLAALRAIQRNDVLPRTPAWLNIAGGKASGDSASAFSLYYSLDLSVPFFLRGNTVLSGFLSLYRQGLIRMSFNRGLVEISLALVPGSGSGVNLVPGYPIDIGGRPSNRIYGTALSSGSDNSRIFFTEGNTAYSLDIADNTLHELSGQQGTHWVIPADGTGERNSVNAWVVTDRGRVILVDRNMEPARGFPVVTGHRLSSPPAAFDGRLYLCDENGRIHTIDENGVQRVWETSFIAAVRSPPSFLPVTVRRETTVYAAVYPKSFIGEIWLLDADGKVFPNWPAPIAVSENEDDDFNFGIGFGSPLLFAHNNRLHVAFINQTGQLLVYDENAAPIPPFPLALNGVFYQQPVFDGEYLWIVSADGMLFRVNLNGDVLFHQIKNFSVMEEGYMTFFDADNDGVPDIFITGEGNALHGFTRHFRSLEDFPLPVWGRPFFIPAQGSRKAEVFGMGMDRKLYRWQFR